MVSYVIMGLGILLLAASGVRGGGSAHFALVVGSSEQHMRIVVSVAILGAALYVLVFTEREPQWATGALGTVLGYWLPKR